MGGRYSFHPLKLRIKQFKKLKLIAPFLDVFIKFTIKLKTSLKTTDDVKVINIQTKEQVYFINYYDDINNHNHLPGNGLSLPIFQKHRVLFYPLATLTVCFLESEVFRKTPNRNKCQ